MRSRLHLIALLGLILGLLLASLASRSSVGAGHALSGVALRASHDHGGRSGSSNAAPDFDNDNDDDDDDTDDDLDDLDDVSRVQPPHPLRSTAGWALHPLFSYESHAIEPATPPPRG